MRRNRLYEKNQRITKTNKEKDTPIQKRRYSKVKQITERIIKEEVGFKL